MTIALMKILEWCKITTMEGRKVQGAMAVDSRVTCSYLDWKALLMKARKKNIQ